MKGILVVVILFFAIALLSLQWDDASIVASCSRGFFGDLKYILKTGLKLMDEDDEWNDLE